MPKLLAKPTWFSLPWLLFAAGAHAQAPADAGALQQNIERERQSNLPARVTTPVTPTPDLKPSTSGTVLKVKGFVFRGNRLLTNEQLEKAVALYAGRTLDFKQLQAAASAVAEAYRQAGWVASAFLPAQDIADGKVIIEVVEAVFGGTKIEGQITHVRTKQLLNMVAAQLEPGQPVEIAALDRAQLLADDLPGVAVAGALGAGSGPGQTDLIFKIADEPAYIVDTRFDNNGARSTGTARASANLYVNSPAGIGDQINATVFTTEGSRYARLGYSVPVGSDGWRVGSNASHLGYSLLDAPGEGTSQSWGLEARYPVVRARLANLYFALNADQKAFDNRLNGLTTTRYSTEVFGISLSGNLFDDIAGGGANTAAIKLVNGQRHNQTGTTGSSYSKLSYALARQQVITTSLSAYVSWDGQTTTDTLDTSESFYLGGINGVRAYPTNEGRGSSGDLAKIELRWRATSTLSSAVFYDHGRVSNRDGSPSYELRGAGVALTWQAMHGVNFSATLARRLGDNPNAGLTGTDQDGSLNLNRLWLSGSLAF